MQVAGDASIEVELQARNAVTDIAVCETSLPADGITAGSSTLISAQVTAHMHIMLHVLLCHNLPRILNSGYACFCQTFKHELHSAAQCIELSHSGRI